MEIVIKSGSEDYFNHQSYFEILCNKSEIYNVKKIIEKKVHNFISTDIEWKPLNYIEINKKEKEDVEKFFYSLDDDDDVQNVYSNVKYI